MSRRVPFVVQSAWYVLDYHRHHTCRMCTGDRGCPNVRLARSQIIVWRRVRAW